jgi:uncharacterized membrane protein
MDTNRATERTVGTLFIVATVGSIAASAALGSVLDGPDYLADLAAHQGRVILAALIFLVAACSAFATSFLLFPILRRHAEGLAAGNVGLRAFENVFYVAGVVTLLVMLTVSQSDAIGAVGATDLPLLGATLLAFHDWSILIGTLIFFALGAATLNYVSTGRGSCHAGCRSWDSSAPRRRSATACSASSVTGPTWGRPSCSWPCRSPSRSWCSPAGSSHGGSTGPPSTAATHRNRA